MCDCGNCIYKPWLIGVKRFENAIVEFGVENALEYFATPDDEKHIFHELIDMENNKKYHK